MEKLLKAVENAHPAAQREAMDYAEEQLTCEVVKGDGRRCGWAGNESPGRPRTLATWREYLPGLVERFQKHMLRHLSPGRFAAAAVSRHEEIIRKLCQLPSDQQPPGIREYWKIKTAWASVPRDAEGNIIIPGKPATSKKR